MPIIITEIDRLRGELIRAIKDYFFCSDVKGQKSISAIILESIISHIIFTKTLLFSVKYIKLRIII